MPSHRVGLIEHQNCKNGDVGFWIWLSHMESWLRIRRTPGGFHQRLSPRLLPRSLAISKVSPFFVFSACFLYVIVFIHFPVGLIIRQH